MSLRTSRCHLRRWEIDSTLVLWSLVSRAFGRLSLCGVTTLGKSFDWLHTGASSDIDSIHYQNLYTIEIYSYSNWTISFSVTWLLTWIVDLSTEVDDVLVDADSAMKFSSLYLSLVSSVISLSMAQFKMRKVLYGFRTTTKQQVLYALSCLLNTTCNILVLINLQTALSDICIMVYIADTYSSVCKLGPFIVFNLLLMPGLYDFLVLPTSRLNIDICSLHSSEFLHFMKYQCLILGFYLGITATVNCVNWVTIAPLLTQKLMDLANKITNGTVQFESTYDIEMKILSFVKFSLPVNYKSPLIIYFFG